MKANFRPWRTAELAARIDRLGRDLAAALDQARKLADDIKAARQ